MNPQPIAEFVRMCGSQRKAAEALDIPRNTIATWISRGTVIYVVPGPTGEWGWYQVRGRVVA